MSYQAEIVTGDESKRDRAGRVVDVPRPQFTLFYDPTDWQVLPSGEIRPSISHISMAPGAGADPDGNFEPERIRRISRGMVEIPLDVLGEGRGYQAKYLNRRGRGVYRSIFLQPYESEGVTKWRPDSEAIAKFIRLLKKRGLIKAPRPSVVRGLMGQVSRKRARLGRVQPTDRADAVSRWREKMEMFDRQLRALDGELANSIKLYGDEVSPGRAILDQVHEMFDAELDEDDEPAPAPAPAPAAPAAKPQTQPPQAKK